MKYGIGLLFFVILYSGISHGDVYFEGQCVEPTPFIEQVLISAESSNNAESQRAFLKFFTSEEIHRLQSASSLPVAEKDAPHEGIEKEYEVVVMYSSKLNTFLVITGELHYYKTQEAYNRGLQLAQDYSVRLYELVPPEEMRELVNKNDYVRHAVHSPPHAGHGQSTDSNHPSLISTLIEPAQGQLGFTVEMEKSLPRGILVTSKDSFSTVYSKDKNGKKVPIQNASDAVQFMTVNLPLIREKVLSKENVEDEKAAHVPVNLPLEIGEYIQPSNDDEYKIKKREERMFQNILTYANLLEQASDGTPKKILVVVGQKHVQGLPQLLENSEADFQPVQDYRSQSFR